MATGYRGFGQIFEIKPLNEAALTSSQHAVIATSHKEKAKALPDSDPKKKHHQAAADSHEQAAGAFYNAFAAKKRGDSSLAKEHKENAKKHAAEAKSHEAMLK